MYLVFRLFSYLCENEYISMRKLGLYLGLIVLLISAIVLYGLNSIRPIKELVGLAIDRMGMTRNTYDIRVDEKLRPYIYIYWLGENGTEVKDRMLLFYRTFNQGIPDCYGKNNFVIKTKSDSTLYNKMGILKLYAFAKHHYSIDLNLKDTLLIVDWSIENWYSEKISSTDTIHAKTYEF